MSIVIYGPVTLPSGKVIKFRRPTGMDRTNILETLQISQEDAIKAGIQLSSYLQSKVVTEVDGKPTDANYKNLFNDWDDLDIQYYQSLNNEMFALTEEKQAEVKSRAAFLLKNSTCTDGSSLQENATVA